jgi:predicted O-methyltransferase YrrM
MTILSNHPAQSRSDVYWTDGDATTPVFQRPTEFAQLLALFDERKPRRILEIGTYYGGTLKQWLTRGHTDLVVSVDLFQNHYDPRPKAAQWAAQSSVDVVFMQGNSHDPNLIEAVRSYGPFDWVYIDADHYYAPAKADWRNYGEMCAPGGIVALHDIVACPRVHPEIEVPRLWAEIKAEFDTTEFVEDYGATWGGNGVVFR